MEKEHRNSRLLGVLQIFIGIGAVVGGAAFLVDPSGTGIGIDVGLLEGSPFRDYFIPGLVLLAVNGLGSLAGAWLTLQKHRFAGFAGMGLGLFLMAWIVIQVSILGGIHWLQILYFALGLVEAALGYLVFRRTA
jgi:hypothetical protein